MQETRQIKCKACGGTVAPLANNPRYFKCDYCGNVTTTMTDRETVRLERAFCKLRDGDFDDAESDFEYIISQTPDSYEAYWGKALSKFGIVYVDDTFGGKKVPTLNKMSRRSFVSDVDYTKAMQNAPTEIGLAYAEQAKGIERILKGQQKVSASEDPYDIFICYKESDKEHNITRTRDSYECSELYVHLTGLGYKVFYARETLRSYIAEDYEPYIYNALATAKAMIVYSTSAEYVKATWVKNEWSRYLQMINAGKKDSNSLIFVVSGMAIEDAPQVLANKQSMNATARTFYTDLASHLKKLSAKNSGQGSNPLICAACGTIQDGEVENCSACGAPDLIRKTYYDMLKKPTPSFMKPRVDPFADSKAVTAIDPFDQKPNTKKGCSTKVDPFLLTIALLVFFMTAFLVGEGTMLVIMCMPFCMLSLAGGIMLTIFRALKKMHVRWGIATIAVSLFCIITAIAGLMTM